MNQIHVEIEGQARAVYGGIESIKTSDARIEFTLSDEARKRLKVDGDICIDLAPDVPNLDKGLTTLHALASKHNIPMS